MALPVISVDWPFLGSRPLKYELFSRSGLDFICTQIRGMEFLGNPFRKSASVKRFAGRETKPAPHQQTEKREGHEPKIIIPTHPFLSVKRPFHSQQPGPHRPWGPAGLGEDMYFVGS